MASTALSDVIQPSNISAYVTAAMPDVLPFIASGAAIYDPQSNIELGGDFAKVRKFTEDVTAAEVNDGSQSTPAAIASYNEIFPVCHRKRVRGVDDVIKAALGRGDANAVNTEIATQSANFWAKAIETSIVKMLTGVMDGSGGALRTTHLSDIAVDSTTAAVPASYNAVIDAAALTGDNMDSLGILVVHSKVWANLRKEMAGKANFLVAQQDAANMARSFDGMTVIVSDLVPTSGSSTYKHFTSFLVRRGALYIAVQRDFQTLAQVEATYPREIIAQTLDYAVGMRGVKWSVADTNPTDTLLAEPTHYAKVATNNKEIGVVALVTNAT